MTRINAGIPVADLCDAHLRAEHRELTRIPNAVLSDRAVIEDIPRKFTLGPGHVKFFYTRLKYLHNRYADLYQECRRRGFNVYNKESSFQNIPSVLYNDWEPTDEARTLIRSRISERLQGMSNTKKTVYV